MKKHEFYMKKAIIPKARKAFEADKASIQSENRRKQSEKTVQFPVYQRTCVIITY